MDDDSHEDNILIGLGNEEIPVVEVPEPKKLEEWVVVGPLSISPRFSMHLKEALVRSRIWIRGWICRWGPSCPGRITGFSRLTQALDFQFVNSPLGRLG